MLDLEVTPGEVRFHHPAPASHGGVIALLGMAGGWVGSGGILLDEPLTCRLASRMLMAEYAAVDEEVLDAVGEITNMVIGNVKNALEEDLGPLGLSIPTVIFGHEFSTRTASSNWILVPFSSDGGQVEVYVCLEPNRHETGISEAGLRPQMASQ